MAPWVELEEHINELRERIDSAVLASHARRAELRDEILTASPEIRRRAQRPTDEALQWAKNLLVTGIVAAADGTVAAVPLLSGTKIQVGVVIVTNTGDSVRLVTRVLEHELANQGETALEFFENLRRVHGSSNLASRALMLFGERTLLLDQPADWRMIHGELIPWELRTGVGKPAENLPPSSTWSAVMSLINIFSPSVKVRKTSRSSMRPLSSSLASSSRFESSPTI